MNKPGLAWGRDDTTAAPAAWVPWSQRVPEAPGETGTQDQGTDGARRPRVAGGSHLNIISQTKLLFAGRIKYLYIYMPY